MEITGQKEYYHTDASSKKMVTKYNSDTEINMAEVYKNEVLNWEEKIKEKASEDSENDREKNIKMSEKQWQALMDKVDNAINTHKLDIKTDVIVDCSKPNDENK